MARRSLKPQLNQIRTWVRQGRTDAWIAHQLDVSVKDISGFKGEHDLVADAPEGESDLFGPRVAEEEPDLRSVDEARVAAELEAEAERLRLQAEEELAANGDDQADEEAEDEPAADEAGVDREGESDAQSRRRRGRRGGRGRGRARGGRKALDGTFDHGEDGYGLWLDPAIQDDAVYAEHWAGHRSVSVAIEADRIVITRAGADAAGSADDS